MMIIDVILVFVGVIAVLVIGGIILAIVLITSKKKKDEVPNGIICSKCGFLNNTEYCSECGNKLR